ncbi:MAG: thioredoxin family protein [Limnobacter sp.]|nr:thioredoxin family protein [Limnobacter sp.]
MAVTTPQIDRTFTAPDFVLPAVDAGVITRDQARGPKGLLVMFICNHCPYVMAIIDRLVRDAKQIQALGIGVIAISSNDVITYPEDSFEKMKLLADQHCFSFPYAYDESQEVAKAYDAVCTPDFFGFNADLQLQYRGRLDASGRQAAAADVRRELFEAMRLIAETGRGPEEQTPSMGCSIKWK